MNESCDWQCPSISRYVGTMLNGAASHVNVVVLYLPLSAIGAVTCECCVFSGVIYFTAHYFH